MNIQRFISAFPNVPKENILLQLTANLNQLKNIQKRILITGKKVNGYTSQTISVSINNVNKSIEYLKTNK